ncbi:hypothetical protein [Brevundimonas sp.]|uniref:hypothetical protein n=1 Tax=Brevundimonas sp. TaxID=1871086 RepID=UPI0028AD2CD1|nr:hypothetical protein [Brevundimonas sp.]
MITTSGPGGYENISGSVDSLEGDYLLGWAAADSDQQPVIVEAFLDKKLIGTALADQFRGDLPGKVAFKIQLYPLPSAPAGSTYTQQPLFRGGAEKLHSH